MNASKNAQISGNQNNVYQYLSHFAKDNVHHLKNVPTHELVPQHIQQLTPYKPGRPSSELCQELGIKKFINLASNENCFGQPKSSTNAIKKALKYISSYPDAAALELRQALAQKFKVKIENVTLGNGSESIISNIVRTFLFEDDEFLTSEGTFIGVTILVKAHGAKLVTVPLKNYEFDLKAILNSITSKTKIIYICNPNNPTGTIIEKAEFEEFLAKVPPNVLVILDEAYYEFACGYPNYPDSLNYRYDNVLTLRTFSKAYGLAGLRIGYGLGHESLIDYIHRIKLPFEPNTLAQVAAKAALDDKSFLTKTVSNNNYGKSYLESEFEKLGLDYVPTYANFVMIDLKTPQKVNYIFEQVLKKGFVTRPLTNFGLPNCLRITIGTKTQNKKLITIIKDLI